MATSTLSTAYFSDFDHSKLHIGLVTTEWNKEIIDRMHNACIEILSANHINSDQIYEICVPGSYELPFGARLLLEQHKLDAVICLGCVIKGETSHDEHINRAVSSGLMQLGLMTSTPVIFGVLTTNDEAQAIERSGGKKGNKGADAALTALKMIGIAKQLKPEKKKIGY
jgi:6,7-dimethyl-8-ribityllumazine synthase